MSNSLIRLLKFAEKISDSGDIEAFNSFCVQFDAFVRKNSQIEKMAHMEPKNDGTTPNPFRKNMDYSSWEGSPYYGSVSDFMKKFPGGIRDWIEWRNKTEKERFQLWDPKKNKERVAKLETLIKLCEEDIANEAVWKNENKSETEFWAVDYGINWSWYVLLKPEGEGYYILKHDRIHHGDSHPITNTDYEIREGDGRIAKSIRLRGEHETDWNGAPILNPKYIFDYPRFSFEDEQSFNKKAHFEPVGPDNTKDFPDESHLYSGDENVGDYKSVKEYIDKRRKETGQEADDAAMDAAKDFVNYYKLLLKGKTRRNKEK